MKTMINIKADRKVKEKAQRVARELGLPLSTVINAYLRQFIRNKEVHFFIEGELKPSVKRRLDRLQKDVKEGKNLSPVFHSAKEMDTYLNSLEK
jgi:addiction module RelB/DinJ family antitoxin